MAFPSIVVAKSAERQVVALTGLAAARPSAAAMSSVDLQPAELPQASELLQATTDLGVLGFIQWAPGARALTLCPVAQGSLDFAAGEPVTLRRLLRGMPGTHRRALHRAAKVADATQQPQFAFDADFAPHPGSPLRQLRGSVRLTRDAQGHVTRALVSLLDASEHVRMAQALEQSTNQLRDAEEIANIGYWEWSFITRKLRISDGALRMLKRDSDTLNTFEHLITMVPADQREWVVGLFTQAHADRLPLLRYEIQLINPDGSVTHLHTVVRLEYGRANGKTSRLQATVQDVTEVRSYRRQLHSLSFFDPLTQLPNRALCMDRLREGVAEAARLSKQLGVLVLGIDRFKDINESLGHAAGDELLKLAAARLSQVLRGYDTVGRIGGDEFALVLPEVRQPADLDGIASKVLNAFTAPFPVAGQEVFVSVSIGGALYPLDATEVDTLMQHADAALHHAKHSGRNNFQFYQRELTTQAATRVTLESELRKAIERQELELHYQPKYDMASGRLTGAEALMRWNHPQRGLVAPMTFIPLAEDTGLIVPMGEWALQSACAAATAWNTSPLRAGKTPLCIAVNLSPRQLNGGHFVDVLRQTLAAGCDPTWIELEITESMLLDSRDTMRDMLRAIADMGVSIAIDDFGTGYSALSYLTRFPVHTLKIDRSFVKGLPDEKGSAELVKAVVSLGRSLNMTLVAEGVETEAQAAHLAALGCDQAQGYWYAKPMPHAAFDALQAKNEDAPPMGSPHTQPHTLS
jgi:diguanylate cyclase (GGDEF)-like protein